MCTLRINWIFCLNLSFSVGKMDISLIKGLRGVESIEKEFEFSISRMDNRLEMIHTKFLTAICTLVLQISIFSIPHLLKMFKTVPTFHVLRGGNMKIRDCFRPLN